MVSTKKVCISAQNIFFIGYQYKPFQQGKILQQGLFVLISGFGQIYAGCCPLPNVYFNDMQTNKWRSFTDKGHLFYIKSRMLESALNLGVSATEIRRVSLLRIFFVSLDKSVLLHCRCLMSKFPEILILVCRKIFCFLSDFTRNFLQWLWFCSYIRI